MTSRDDKARELADAVSVAVGSCDDVLTLGRFSPAVDPVRWVEQLRAHLDDALRRHDGKPRRLEDDGAEEPEVDEAGWGEGDRTGPGAR